MYGIYISNLFFKYEEFKKKKKTFMGVYFIKRGEKMLKQMQLFPFEKKLFSYVILKSSLKECNDM